MSIRYIEIQDEDLKTLVEAKGNIVDKGRKHYKKMEELHAKGNEIGAERNAIVAEILEKTAICLKDEKLGEFELATTTDIKDGVVRVEIVDRVAQFKENMRKEKEEAQRREAGEETPQELLQSKQAKLAELLKSIPEDKASETLDSLLAVLE